MLRTSFEEELNANPREAVGQRILAHNFGQIFAVAGSGILRVRHDEEKSHADFVAGFAGLKVDPGARDADAAAHVVEMGALGVGGTNAHELGDFAATAGAALSFCASCGNRVLRRLIHLHLKGPIAQRHGLLGPRSPVRSGAPCSVNVAQLRAKAYRGSVPMPMERYSAIVVRRYGERKEGRRKINERMEATAISTESTEVKSSRGLIP